MRRPSKQRRAKRTILAAICGVFLLQAAFSWLLPWWHPDTEYRVRKETLAARIAENPEQPLFAMVGSSRVSFAFDPEMLDPIVSPDGRTVLSFNFGHFNAGPTANLLAVDRLIKSNIKPRWLVVEINPGLCGREWPGFVHLSGWGDLGIVSKYYSPSKFGASFARNHLLLPWFRHRAELQERYLQESHGDRRDLDMTRFGLYGKVNESIDPSLRASHTNNQYRMFGPALSEDFHVSPTTTGTTRDLIERCRSNDINVGFILMPEGETFRSWYSPQAEARLKEFLTALTRDFKVPVFDARQWLDDSFFSDSHHVLRHGTREFTHRFQREVLEPLITKTLPVEARIAMQGAP